MKYYNLKLVKFNLRWVTIPLCADIIIPNLHHVISFRGIGRCIHPSSLFPKNVPLTDTCKKKQQHVITLK